MKKIFKFLYPTLILAAICLIVSLALSSTNSLTEDKIENINAENTKRAMSRVLKAETYTEKTFDNTLYYEAVNGNDVTGYIFITSANGYGGEVKVMTAVLPDNTVKAVEILDVSGETPGLGQNATKKEFYGQFSGLSNNITVVKSGANTEKVEINAITGATITSRAVTKAVNEALDMCKGITTETEASVSE